MGKRLGFFACVLGAVLLLLAGGFLLKNHREEIMAEDHARLVLRELERAIPASPQEVPEGSALTVQGEAYCAILSIPALDLTLPVLENWSYPLLKLAPCRQAGSIQTGDLVIAAHNYDSHFGRLSTLEPGTTVLLTDTAGNRYTYILSHLQELSPYSTDRVLSGEYQLVLYTCTPGGSRRIAAFCIREN